MSDHFSSGATCLSVLPCQPSLQPGFGIVLRPEAAERLLPQRMGFWIQSCRYNYSHRESECMDVVNQLRAITLGLTVTAGRSGTKLLAILLSEALRIAAHHEPMPRINYVMRSFVEAPGAAGTWLLTEKFPAMLALARNGIYVETSHLFCKGLIEQVISLGIRPSLIILTRPAREIASSLFKINVIPQRTENGRLVLLGPEDPGVLRLQNWRQYSDYQLCFWYAREIERRQAQYTKLAADIDLNYICVAMQDLRTREVLDTLARFLGTFADEQAFARQELVLSKNRNSREDASGSAAERPLPANLDDEESMVDASVFVP